MSALTRLKRLTALQSRHVSDIGLRICRNCGVEFKVLQRCPKSLRSFSCTGRTVERPLVVVKQGLLVQQKYMKDTTFNFGTLILTTLKVNFAEAPFLSASAGSWKIRRNSGVWKGRESFPSPSPNEPAVSSKKSLSPLTLIDRFS
jgi:hypothetical protein